MNYVTNCHVLISELIQIVMGFLQTFRNGGFLHLFVSQPIRFHIHLIA